MKTQERTIQERIAPPHADLIQDLINCALACEACATACLAEKDVMMMTRCIELDRDCADTCFQAARLLMRDSEFVSQFLTATEEICQLCAEECKKHEHEHCKICADACEQCAEACRSNHGKLAG